MFLIMKNKLGKWIIFVCKIHLVEEEAFGEGTKGMVENKNKN